MKTANPNLMNYVVISQLQLDHLVVQETVGDLQSLRKVESPAFVKLTKVLQPSKKAPSRKEKKKYILRQLKKQTSDLKTMN